MASNRLKLNPSKTELIWLSSSRRSRHCPSGEQTIAGVQITPSLHVRNLGVMVDGELTMGTHVSHLTRTCFYHLRQLRVVRRSLTTDASHSLVRALVHSRLDYCNSVLAGLPQYSLNKLQSILRASARLVLKLPGSASVSDLMRDELHWLPVPLRIQFKLCCTVFKCLHGAAPPYLSEFCQPLSSLAGRYQLRSAAAGDLPNSTLKNCDNWASRIFDIRPSCLEWSSNKLERSYTNFSGLQETIENTLFHDDVNSGNAPLRRLFERRITNTSFNSIQFNSI